MDKKTNGWKDSHQIPLAPFSGTQFSLQNVDNVPQTEGEQKWKK